MLFIKYGIGGNIIGASILASGDRSVVGKRINGHQTTILSRFNAGQGIQSIIGQSGAGFENRKKGPSEIKGIDVINRFFSLPFCKNEIR